MTARVVTTVAMLVLLTTLQAVATGNGADSRPEIIFDHVTVSDGLSQNSIQSVLQDDCGYLWIATQDGLNRYDGYSFTVYRRSADETGLTDNVVWSLYQDSEGALWIGTGAGLNRLEKATDTFVQYRHDPNNDRSLSHPIVRDIFEDSLGALWVATDGGGLNRLDRTGGEFSHVRHDPADEASLSSDRIRSITEDRNGFLWVGTEDAGVNRLNPKSLAVERFEHDPADDGSLSHDRVTRLMVDRQGVLWVATDGGGLNRLDADRRSFVRYRHEPGDAGSIASDFLQTVYEDSAGRIWAGHYRGGGVSLFNRESERFHRYTSLNHRENSLNDDFVRTIYEDRSGVLWFGTFVGGLNKYDDRGARFRLYRNEWWNESSLSDNTVRAFYRAGSTLYVGTESGLNVLDLETGMFEHHTASDGEPGGIPHNVVRSLFPDADGNLWIATHGGLSRLNRDDGSFTTFRHDPDDPDSISCDTVWRVYVDSRGMVWAGARNALNRLDPDTGRFRRFTHDPNDPQSIGGDRILAIYEDSFGKIWISTATSGVSVYDPVTDVFERYAYDGADERSLGSNTVFAIIESADGAVWMGTRDGLRKLDRHSETFTRYTEADGLPNNVVYGILEDEDGYLWISTNRGIARFCPQDEMFVAFDTSDGLQGDEFNNGAYYRFEDGTIYFGGVQGFNAFEPREITVSDYNSPVVITSFGVLNEEVAIERACAEEAPLQLSHRDNYLSFEFAALDFSSPETNRYAYKLEGVDKDWVYSGSRRYANYTNLPPGTYTFRVRGTNSDGVWSENTAVLSLEIAAAFWQTLWFRALVVVGLVTVAVFLYRYKTISMLRENLRLENAVHERTARLSSTNADLEQEIAQRQRAEEEIRRIAYYDYLTGLPNRRLFLSFCEKEIASCRRQARRFCIVFIDLDNFKLINDRYGHEAGDAVLAEVARRMTSIVRESDTIARIGGDEFVLLLSEVEDDRGVVTVTQKIIEAITAPIEIKHGQRAIVEVSIGISRFPEDDENLDGLIAKADQAMYAAKRDHHIPDETQWCSEPHNRYRFFAELEPTVAE